MLTGLKRLGISKKHVYFVGVNLNGSATELRIQSDTNVFLLCFFHGILCCGKTVTACESKSHNYDISLLCILAVMTSQGKSTVLASKYTMESVMLSR